MQYCSKDCPDLCRFYIQEENSKIKFIPVKNSFDDKPFLCKKLTSFYKREILTTDQSFIRDSGTISYLDNDIIIKSISEKIKEYWNDNILFIRGSGSLGYMMNYWDKLFSFLPNCYFIKGNPCDETGFIAHEEDFGKCVNPPIQNLLDVDYVIIFGRNAKVVHQHLYSFIKKLKKIGKKIIYIDPIVTSTSKIADLYIQIKPSSDAFLCYAILKNLGYVTDLNIDLDEIFNYTGVSNDTVLFLSDIFRKHKVGMVTGFALQRYSNGKNIVNWINKLAYHTNNIEYLYYGKASKEGYSSDKVCKKYFINLHETVNRIKENYFGLVVIVAANPMVTYPEWENIGDKLKNIPTIVVDTNYTRTSEFASHFVKVGGMFSQSDLQGSYFFSENLGIRRRYSNIHYSDIDVIRCLMQDLNIDFNIKDIDDVEYKKVDYKRVYNLRKLALKKPFIEDGLYRLITLSNENYLNSQLADSCFVDNYIFINKIDAENLLIEDMDKVSIHNEVGEFISTVKISDKVPAGIFMTYKNRLHERGHPNIVTRSLPTDAGLALAYYDCFVTISKINP